VQIQPVLPARVPRVHQIDQFWRSSRKLIFLLLRRKRNLSLAAGAVIPMAAFSKRLMAIPEQPSRGDHARFFSRIRSAKRLKR
jgi:hypothetical protein